MKRAVPIFFWLSLICAVVCVIAARYRKPTPAPTRATSVPKLALEPPRSTLPDAVPADALGSEPPRAMPRAAQSPRTEADFMRRIHDNVRANPELAVSLAEQARQEFGDSADSDERDRLLVDALINLQKIGAARDETLYYYRHHPAGQYRQYLWAMTGARPDPPAGPVPRQ